IYPEFFYQLSQICHNIQSLKIRFEEVISNGLSDLIFIQKNLKYLELSQFCDEGLSKDFTDTIPSLTKHSNTLIKLVLIDFHAPLSFIAKFNNLQELIFEFDYDNVSKCFEELQYVTFPQLQILKFSSF